MQTVEQWVVPLSAPLSSRRSMVLYPRLYSAGRISNSTTLQIIATSKGLPHSALASLYTQPRPFPSHCAPASFCPSPSFRLGQKLRLVMVTVRFWDRVSLRLGLGQGQVTVQDRLGLGFIVGSGYNMGRGRNGTRAQRDGPLSQWSTATQDKGTTFFFNLGVKAVL